VPRAAAKIREAVRISRWGLRARDRLRILLLIASMPVIRRSRRGRPTQVMIRTRRGPVTWRAENHADLAVLDEVLGREIYAVDLALRPATILDLGAHVGASVLFFSERYPDARIIAVEPDPANFRKLRRNVGHLPQVTLVNVAASATAGLLTFHSSGATDSWKSSARRSTPWQRPVKVQALPLDRILEDHGAPPPFFVKIDIEGAETEALASFEGLRHTIAIVGELHPALIPTPVAVFRRLLDGFEHDLPDAVERDTTFRAVRPVFPAVAR
jgi:FkbM family methyltransferase